MPQHPAGGSSALELQQGSAHRQAGRLHAQANQQQADTPADTTPLLDEAGQGSPRPPQKDPEQQIDWLLTGLCFLFPAIGGLLFGFDIGATSGALVSMKSAAVSGTDWYNLSSFQSGLVVSSSLLGALTGSAAAFVVGDRLGRKRELLLGSVLYGAGAGLTWAAPGLYAVLGARALYGLGIGFAMHAAPAYIAETAPSRVRGLLISMKEVFVVLGILAGYAVSYLAVEQVGGWRVMYGAALPAALVLGAGMAWLPDSPRWLLLSGAGRTAAQDALRRARGRFGQDEALLQQEMRGMVRSVEEISASGAASFGALFQGTNRRPLLIGCSLMLFQQITGQPSVLYYAAQIFKDAGFAGDQEATGVSVVLGLFKVIMTGLAVLTVDSWGRRPLLLAGVTGIVAALLALGGAQAGLTGPAATWTSLAALLMYVGCYQVSFGPISWLLVGEIFPLAVRGPASAVATLTNFGSNFVVSFALPTVEDNIGLGNTYFSFAAIGALALISIYLTVPETKGKTLEEIEGLWASDDKGE